MLHLRRKNRWQPYLDWVRDIFFLYLTFLKNLKSTSSRLVVQINEATALRTDLDCGNCQMNVICQYVNVEARNLAAYIIIIVKVIACNNCIICNVVWSKPKSSQLLILNLNPPATYVSTTALLIKHLDLISTYTCIKFLLTISGPALPNTNTQVILCCWYKYC